MLYLILQIDKRWIRDKLLGCGSFYAYSDSVTGVSHSQKLITSLNGNIFRATGRLWGEFSGHRWIPTTKASDAELLFCVRSVPAQTLRKQSIEMSVICDAIAPIMTSL